MKLSSKIPGTVILLNTIPQLASIILAIILLATWNELDTNKIINILTWIIVLQVLLLCMTCFSISIFKIQNWDLSSNLFVWVAILLRIVIIYSSVKLMQSIKNCAVTPNDLLQKDYTLWRDITAYTIIIPAAIHFLILITSAIGIFTVIALEKSNN